MKRLVSFLLAFVALCGIVRAQDPQFSQFFSNPILFNPAFTGTANNRAALNYRLQWVGIPSAYKTFAASYDQRISFGGTDHGIGGSVLTDIAGEGNLMTLRANLAYAYELPITDHSSIRLGLSGGIMQTSVDLMRLRFPDQLDAVSGYTGNISADQLRGNPPSRMNEYVAAGLVFHNKYFYIGGSAENITQPKQTFINASAPNAKLPMKITGVAGCMIPLDEDAYGESNLSISPVVMYRMQGPFTAIDLGVYVNIKPMVIGCWYRTGKNNADAIIPLVGCTVGSFRFGYSYDYTISNLQNRNSGGSHEISLVLEWNREYTKSIKQMPCPRF